MVLAAAGVPMREMRGSRAGKVPWVEGDPFRGSVWGEGGRRRGFHGELLTVALMAAMGGSGASWRRQGRRSAMWHRGVESEGAEVLPQSKRAR